MSYKDELKKQIEELSSSIDVDNYKLNALRQKLHEIEKKEIAESSLGSQQLLQE
jgi:uncharacterized coiled-coil protein SlyX